MRRASLSIVLSVVVDGLRGSGHVTAPYRRCSCDFARSYGSRVLSLVGSTSISPLRMTPENGPPASNLSDRVYLQLCIEQEKCYS